MSFWRGSAARFMRKPLPEFELPSQRYIDLRSAESAQGISSQISLHAPAGIVNGAGLISSLPATLGLAIQSGTPETRFRRWTPEAPDK